MNRPNLPMDERPYKGMWYRVAEGDPGRWRFAVASIERGTGNAKRLTRLANSHVLAQLLSSFHQFDSSPFWLGGWIPNISETFF